MTKKEIATVKSLGHKKFRNELGVFVAEGDKAIEEIINGGLTIKTLYYTQKSKFADLNAPFCQPVSNEEMSRMSFLQTPGASLALVVRPTNNSNFEVSGKELTLVLDDIQDPGNMGTIIRLADWFGISHIICSKNTADCFNPKVVQATMGAIARVEIIYTDLQRVLNNATRRNIPILGTFMNGEDIYTAELPQYGIVVMGNEGSGISKSIENLVSRRITIPSFKEKNVESLNVAIATAICCSELKRRQF